MRAARERGKIECEQTQNRTKTEQKAGRTRKDSEMHGEGCEDGEGGQDEGIRGCQSSIKNTSHLESAFLVPTIASQARYSVSATQAAAG